MNKKFMTQINVDNLVVIDGLLDLIELGNINEISVLNFFHKIGLNNLNDETQVYILNKLINVFIKLPMYVFNNRSDIRQKALDGLRTVIKNKESGNQKVRKLSFLNSRKNILEYC
jgi:hypothetical protein